MRDADRSPEVDDAAPVRLGLNSRQFIGSRGQVVRWIAAGDWYGPRAQPIPAYEAPAEDDDEPGAVVSDGSEAVSAPR